MVDQINLRHAALFLGAFASLALSPLPAARAQEQESPIHAIAKRAGFVSDPDPPDFVVKSRPAAPKEAIPAFATPEEPPSTVMTPAQIKAMDADLESAGKKHDALRAGFAPSAKAVAEAEAAKRAKLKKKTSKDADKAAF
jgi:hypothetical protein